MTLRWDGEVRFRDLANGATFRRVHSDGLALDPTLYERAGHRAVPVMSEGGTKASPLLPLDSRVVPTSMAEAMRPVPEGNACDPRLRVGRDGPTGYDAAPFSEPASENSHETTVSRGPDSGPGSHGGPRR